MSELLTINLPTEWIHPAYVKVRFPMQPGYIKAIDEYVAWMNQPHASLKHLSWGENLDFAKKPLNPDLQQRELQEPTTYFIYEAFYTFFAGMVTNEIKPREGLDRARAAFLREQIIYNFAEMMRVIAQLGTRKLSFDQVHDPSKGTYKLSAPYRNRKARRPLWGTNVSKMPSFNKIEYRGGSLNIMYDEVNFIDDHPREVDGMMKSYSVSLRFERARTEEEERRLMMDLDLVEIIWENNVFGKPIPKQREGLVDEFFGDKIHHVDLAVLKGNVPGQYDINHIIRSVTEELGLSRLIGF